MGSIVKTVTRLSCPFEIAKCARDGRSSIIEWLVRS